jgi:hypothetical protein
MVAEARETGRGKPLEAKALKTGEVEVFYEREVIGTISRQWAALEKGHHGHPRAKFRGPCVVLTAVWANASRDERIQLPVAVYFSKRICGPLFLHRE